MKQEKFKTDHKRHANVLKQEKHFQSFLQEEVQKSSINTVSKEGNIKMWIFAGACVAVLVGLFTMAINLIN